MSSSPRVQTALNRFAFYDRDLDRWNARFGIIENHQFTRHFDTNVILENVTFDTHPGIRVGCYESGVLGVATGVIVSETDTPVHLMREQVAIRYQKTHFVRLDTGEKIATAKRLLFTLKGAYAQFIPDPVVAAVVPVPAKRVTKKVAIPSR